jgi:hypothetical protein
MVDNSPKTGRIVLLGALLLLLGCTAGANPLRDSAAQTTCCTELGGASAGFWLGYWHGLIAPVTFVVSLFSSTTGVYEVHNNGGWYNAGFLFGLMSILGGSGGTYYSRRGDSE